MVCWSDVRSTWSCSSYNKNTFQALSTSPYRFFFGIWYRTPTGTKNVKLLKFAFTLLNWQMWSGLVLPMTMKLLANPLSESIGSDKDRHQQKPLDHYVPPKSLHPSVTHWLMSHLCFLMQSRQAVDWVQCKKRVLNGRSLHDAWNQISSNNVLNMTWNLFQLNL